MERVIAYVDGNSLYSGLCSKGWQRFLWLDVRALAGRCLNPGQELVMTHYFAELVEGPEEERRRQAVYLEALRTLPDFRGHYVPYLSETIRCRGCGREVPVHIVKMTPVELATELLADAALDRFDAALLFSAEGSLAGPVATARRLGRHRPITVVFPPGLRALALEEAASGVLHVGNRELAGSLFPNTVTRKGDAPLRRPEEWR